MATRLQSDEVGKDSKWADIDDDEDDWAPETVEWMDGTKSSVVAAETPPTLLHFQEDGLSSPVILEKPMEPQPTAITALHKPIISQSTKTILRPGSQLNNSQKTGTHKLGPDQPTSTTKSSAPLPVKSPWATLPPVEKTTPFNPPVQQSQRPFQRDPHGFDSLPPVPTATKEIATDDFNRTWREDRGTKELFNAQSGRYEPAGEAPKGARQDHGHRQPAVLQRPSQILGNGPAEPSAAFQTSRSNTEGSSWPRRRTSSNLSSIGGRRPSFALSQDLPQPFDRLDAKSPISASATDPSNVALADAEHIHDEQVLEENVKEPETQNEPPKLQEDPVAVQQRMMRERIERARLQKQREQEAEDAEKLARQERLKLKMAALAVPVQSPEPSEIKPKDVGPPVVPSQPPKPPVPTSEGEVAQYGMMKVHQPHPVKKQLTSDVSSNKARADAYPDSRKVSISPSKTQIQPDVPPLPSSAVPAEHATKRLPDSSMPTDKIVGPWKSSSPQDYNWGPNTMNARSSVGANVWGPPMNIERSLGNGVFESKFSHTNFDNRKFDNRLDSNRLDHSLPAAHGPIGAGIKTSTPPRQSHFTQTFLSSDKPLQEQPDDQDIASTHLGSSLQHSIAQTSSLNPLLTAPTATINETYSNNMATAQVTSAPKPVVSYPRGADASWMPAQQRSTPADWAAFGALDKQRREMQQREYAKEYEHKQANRTQPETKHVTYKVFKASVVGVEEIFCRIEDDGSIYTHILARHNKDPNSLRLVEQSKIDHPEHHKDDKDLNKLRGPPAVVIKGAALNDVAKSDSQHRPETPESTIAVLTATTIDDLETRPPAEQGLFEFATNGQIRVKVPKVAKVSLPFSSAYSKSTQQAQAIETNYITTNVTSYTHPATNTTTPMKGTSKEPMTWAELNQKFAPKRSDVNAHTKPAFDVSTANQGRQLLNGAAVRTATAVTFPPITEDIVDDHVTRPCDDDLFGTPEFGTKPAVRIPSTSHQNHQFGYSHDSHMTLAARPHSRFHRPVNSQSVPMDMDAMLFAPRIERSNIKCTIRLPGMETSQVKILEVHAKVFAPTSYRKHQNPSRRSFPSRNSIGHNNGSNSDNNGSVNYGGLGLGRGSKTIKPVGPALSSKPRGSWIPRKTT